MKTKLIFPFLLFACIFSTAAFCQEAPGGGSQCPSSFSVKKNNGNVTGSCNGEAEIRVIFFKMPSQQEIPSLTSLEYQGQALTDITLPVKGVLVNSGHGYISYCIAASSSNKNGNSFTKIPPAAKLVLELTTPAGVVCRTDNVD